MTEKSLIAALPVRSGLVAVFVVFGAILGIVYWWIEWELNAPLFTSVLPGSTVYHSHSFSVVVPAGWVHVRGLPDSNRRDRQVWQVASVGREHLPDYAAITFFLEKVDRWTPQEWRNEAKSREGIDFVQGHDQVAGLPAYTCTYYLRPSAKGSTLPSHTICYKWWEIARRGYRLQVNAAYRAESNTARKQCDEIVHSIKLMHL